MRTGQRQQDILDLLRKEDDEIVDLFEAYFSPPSLEDHVRRANIGLELLDRLAIQVEVKEEICHRALADAGRGDLVERLQQGSVRMKELLAELDRMSAGVSPRDIHVSRGREFDATVAELRTLTEERVRQEEAELIPAVRQAVPSERLAEMGADLEKLRKRSPTRPRPKDPAHETPRIVKRVKAAFDHLRDYPDTAHHTSDTK
jgi:hypothetical protein